MSVSYGASLPDSEFIVNARVEALVALLPTVATFLQFRSGLEREYAKKLSDTTAKARLQAIKDASDRVGSGKQTNTLEAGFMKVLEAADLDAREHLALADALQTKVVDLLNSGSTRLEAIRKKQHQFAGKLLSERDRVYSERDKSKQKYFDACESLEQARQKKSQAKDDRQAEKAGKSYDNAMDDMYIAKSQFLVDTDVANVHKATLYNQQLPALHDDYQILELSTVSHLIHSLHLFTSIQSASLARMTENNAMAEHSVSSINSEHDQSLFVEAHSASKMAAWELPQDLVFEECPVWHDTDEMPTSDSTIVYLQNVKAKASSKLAEVSPVIESKRREIGGLRNLREAYEKDRTLGNPGSVLDNLLDSVRDATLLEITQTAQRAQIELINANLGDDSGSALRPHEFKSSSFVTPATCVVCDGSIWGKGLSCKKCAVAAHVKCELKVPAGCGVKNGAVGRQRSRKLSSASHSTTTSVSSRTPATSILPPPVRGVPPPAATPLQAATVLYAYEAATSFELTVSEGEVVSVVAPEDDAGWIKVSTSDGRIGLIPASYAQLGGALPSTLSEQKALVLYDYEAQTNDELSVSQDEYITVLNPDAGDGWAEASKGGQKGLVPLSYIQL